MAVFRLPVAVRTDFKNTITCMRSLGLSEADVMVEVTRVLHGLYYPEGDDF